MRYSLLALLFGFFLVSCSQSSMAPGNFVVNVAKAQTQKVSQLTDATVIPAESIFALNDTFKTQNNASFQLSSLKGKPTVIGMIFTHCTYACPRLTSDIKSISEKLGANRKNVNLVLVSFDVERDNPAALRKFAKGMCLDPDWILLQGNEQSVRTLSVLLNVQFEKDQEGNFSHTNMVSVLDEQGVLSFQKEGLEADHKETIDNILKLINKK